MTEGDYHSHVVNGSPTPTSEIPLITFVPACDLLAQPSPMRWLVRGVLTHGSMTTLIGAPGTFKSSVALDIAACIATGINWHDRPTKQGAVFFLAGEGNHGIKRRLKAWSIVHDENLETSPLFVSTGGLGLTDPLNAAAIAAEAKRLADITGKSPQLITVDTLARNFGVGDENSAADMSAFISNIDTHLRQFFDCAVLIVHHSGVMDNGRGRGSSALRAAVDTEIITERTDQTVVLKCTKSKDAPEFTPIGFAVRSVELPWIGEDGNLETSFVMHPTELEAVSAKQTGIGSNQSKALETLRSMYDECRQNLCKAGLSEIGALVTIADWRERTTMNRHRFAESITGLERRRLIRLDHPHVILL